LQVGVIERQLLDLGFGLSRKTESGQGQEGRKKNEKPAGAHRAQTLGSDSFSTTTFAPYSGSSRCCDSAERISAGRTDWKVRVPVEWALADLLFSIL
jgi:hypothetical protein